MLTGIRVNGHTGALMSARGKAPTPIDRLFWDRLNELRERAESDREFADRIGIREQLLNNWKRGRNTAGMQSATRISAATGCAAEWLLTGRGAKYRKPGVNLEAVGVQQAAESLAATLAQLVDRYGLDIDRIVELIVRDQVD